jgi:arginine deiminase
MTINPWGVSSETGTLTDVLLCRPDHYRYIPSNTVAEHTLASGAQADAKVLKDQFQQMEAALDQAGVRRHYLIPDADLPYQVYTRDSSQMTPWGATLTLLARHERRGEYAAVLEFYARVGIPMWKMGTVGTFEGGDIHIIRPGLCVVGVSAARTNPRGAEQFAGWLRAQGWEVRLQPIDEHFLHLDVLFCMAAPGLAVACIDVLDPGFVAWLGARGIRTIPVPYREAMRLGCNILALGRDRVISSRGSVGLNAALRAEGLAVLDPELSLFAAGGGGPHCLTCPLAREG